MDYLDLFTSATANFSGFQKERNKAEYVVVGVPFDATSTYRSGARFAPLAIREASLNIETYSFRAETDLEDLKIHDAGDLHISGNLPETLKRLELVTEEILNSGKTPVLIGGEHTITLGATRGIHKDFAVLSFDAHLDLRNEYMDQPICHASFMRRINEIVKPVKIVEVGTRAVCKEEIEYAESAKIGYITSQQIISEGTENTTKEINRLLTGCDHIYLTVDMDALDPAFAPAVQNPEPDGLSTNVLLDLLHGICGKRIVAFDVVEVTPHYDAGATAIQAARVIFEILSHIHRDKGKTR